MSRFLLASIAGLVALSLGGSAHAHGPVGTSYHGSVGTSYHGSVGTVTHSYSYHSPSYTGGTSFVASTPHAYLTTYGTKFSHGYYFGPSNFYSTNRSWSARYGCWTYWNPYASAWYYWSAPQGFYYPISYITIAPPVVVSAPVVAGPVVP